MKRWIKKRVKQLTADRRKFGLMVGLLAVALLLWGRILVKQVPRQAIADPAQKKAPASTTPATPTPTGEHKRIYVSLNETLRRDLFAVDLSQFAQITSGASDSITQEKSRPVIADVDDAVNLATGLRLQSTVLGREPRAIVNGRTLAPGQDIRGFRVVRIHERHVVLERDGLTFVLKM